VAARSTEPNATSKQDRAYTKHSNSLKDDYDRVSKEMTEIIYQDFSPEEAKDFETCLEKILLNLERVEKEEV